MTYYVYRFLDKQDEVIYVGRTNNLKTRMNQHFNPKNKETSQRNKIIEKIDYLEFDSKNHSCMYEIQLIDYYKPKFNKDYLEESINPILIEFRNFDFKIFDEKKLIELKNKKRKVNSNVLSNLRKMEKGYVNYYVENYNFSESEAYMIIKILEVSYGQGFSTKNMVSKKDCITFEMAESLVGKLLDIKAAKFIEEYNCYVIEESFICPNFEI